MLDLLVFVVDRMAFGSVDETILLANSLIEVLLILAQLLNHLCLSANIKESRAFQDSPLIALSAGHWRQYVVLFQPLDPLLMLAVGEGFVALLVLSSPWTAGHEQDRSIFHVIALLDRLAVESSRTPSVNTTRGVLGEPKDDLTNPETLKFVRSDYSEGYRVENGNWDNTIPLFLWDSSALLSPTQPSFSEQSPLQNHAALPTLDQTRSPFMWEPGALCKRGSSRGKVRPLKNS